MINALYTSVLHRFDTDWLYVMDHCKAIDLILRKGRVGEIYNIGGHNERTNLEVVKTIF